jgi:Flp pilus assembly protein TadB
MVPLTALWLPILLAAVIVFVVSSIIHMFLGYHKNDVKAVPQEAAVSDALRKFGIPPGDYVIPRATSTADMRSPEHKEKLAKGPVLFMTVMPNGQPSMGTSMVQWFLYCVLVGMFAAYIAGRALAPGAGYLVVFRFAGATAFAGYGLALLQNSIWWRRNWGATLLSVFDALIYAGLTAGTLGWLWPSA